jgi:hypothetical protein
MLIIPQINASMNALLIQSPTLQLTVLVTLFALILAFLGFTQMKSQDLALAYARRNHFTIFIQK